MNNWKPGRRIRSNLYQKDHLIHRTADEIVAWCGRPLEPIVATKIDGTPVTFEESTRKSELCSECKTKEDEYLQAQAVLKADMLRGQRSGW